jgi:hypothetical protein
MVHVSLTILSEWHEFPSAPCFARGGGGLMTAGISMLLKSRASPDMLPFSLCNKKRLAIRHMNRLLFPKTLSIPPYDREVGRAKDLSAPSLIIHCAKRAAGFSVFLKQQNALP